MNKRTVISRLVGAIVIIAAIWAYVSRPSAPVLAAPAKDAPVTPIVDGTAIDFSSGKAVVTSTDADRASMDLAVKQIDDAAKGVTFKADPATKK